MEIKSLYYEKLGEDNTEPTLALAKARAKELGISKFVVASSRGVTAVKAMNAFAGMTVVIVGHEWGHYEANATDFLEENRKIVESKGGKIVAGVHGFGGINNAFRARPAGPPPGAAAGGPPAPPPAPPAIIPIPGEIIARTLGLFGRGLKVAAEITIMAADAGHIRTDEDVIAIAGSSRGADTAVVIKPANSARFFELKIREILCKPRV